MSMILKCPRCGRTKLYVADRHGPGHCVCHRSGYWCCIRHVETASVPPKSAESLAREWMLHMYDNAHRQSFNPLESLAALITRVRNERRGRCC